MSRKLEKDLYQAYCALCLYTDKKPLQKSKWKKGLQKPVSQNRTVEDIKKELEEIKEHT